ncbi:lipopolysaccharide biosynthesis protein [Ottowia sp. VDI28]|uniref:lipopolysaccharide biosynthesis protein n=1 Tax=Ottowia sp. VDI28 TaxID=3133968 RepID=UPI003C2AF471
MIGSIFRNTFRTSLVLGVRLFLQAGTLLLVARTLGPEKFGIFTGLAALAVLLGMLSTFGMHLVLLAEMSKEPARRALVLPYAVPSTLLFGGLLLVVYGLICAWLLGLNNIPIEIILLIGFTEILLQPLLILMVSEHHAIGKIAYSQILQLLPIAFRMIAATGIFFLHPSRAMHIYAACYAVASVLSLVYGASRLPARWPAWRDWRLPNRNEWIDAFGYAAINVSKAGPAELDKTLALRLLPHSAAGVYAAAARVVGAITLPVTAMTLSALPKLFRDGGKLSGRYLLKWMYGAASLYSLLIAGALWLATPWISSLFGVQYEGINSVIRLLCFAIPGMALRLVAGNALMAFGRPWIRVEFEAAGLIILLFTSMVLTDRCDMAGLALAVACAEWSMAMIGTWLVVRESKKNRGSEAHVKQEEAE